MKDYENLQAEIVANGRDRLEIVLFKTPNNRYLVQINQTDVLNKEIQNLVKIGAKNLPGVIEGLQKVLETIEASGKANHNRNSKFSDLVEMENALIKEHLEDMIPISELAIRYSMKETEIIEMFKLRNISMAPAKYVSPYWKKGKRKR